MNGSGLLQEPQDDPGVFVGQGAGEFLQGTDQRLQGGVHLGAGPLGGFQSSAPPVVRVGLADDVTGLFQPVDEYGCRRATDAQQVAQLHRAQWRLAADQVIERGHVGRPHAEPAGQGALGVVGGLLKDPQRTRDLPVD